MTNHATPPPRNGQPVDRNVVLDAALGIIDREGIDGVTVRGLAAEVGVSPMSLYRHFASKDQLYDFLLERVLQRMVPRVRATSWRHQLEEVGRQVRVTFLRHPNWLPLLARVLVRDRSRRRIEKLLTLVWPERLSSKRKLETVLAVIEFTVGSVLIEHLTQGGLEIARRRAEPRLPPPSSGSIASDSLRLNERPSEPSIEAREEGEELEAATTLDSISFDRVFDLAIRSMVSDEPRTLPRRSRSSGLRIRTIA